MVDVPGADVPGADTVDGKPEIKISGAFKMKPVDALAYFERQGLRTSVNWSEMQHVEFARDFTVAKIAKLDMLTGMHNFIQQGLADGATRPQIEAGIIAQLKREDMWGLVTDKSKTGTAEPVFFGPRRVANMVATNIRVARAAGQWERIQRAKADRPYLLYRHKPCRHPRYWHLKWDGTILPVDHPWWRKHFPPNGWGCGCIVIQLSEADLRRRKLKVSAAPPDEGPVRRWERPATGDVHFVPAGIDPGWDYNPGVASLQALAEKAAVSIAEAAGLGMIEPARQTLASIVDSPAFIQFLVHDETAQAFPMMVLDPADAAVLSARTVVARLSAETLAKQARNHPELALAEYRGIPGAVHAPIVIKQSERVMIYVQPAGTKFDVIVVKATEDGGELYVTSYRQQDRKHLQRLVKGGTVIRGELK